MHVAVPSRISKVFAEARGCSQPFFRKSTLMHVAVSSQTSKAYADARGCSRDVLKRLFARCSI